ncbi:MerR family transcriptional regulator [Labrys sp. KNU-23]|uniref:MerR family transcriptional regulator n=1 Tax=Labrys sp. KNU-23 TaxID=2789216 RepID=UPI0011EC8C9A|nr:MerR family transcriptional regulator [Labrys sp. KNU-23]QEN88094.1 MerR family transcriptional regulator [Labrys sp. KNU-23]
MSEKTYTIGELSKLSGIAVRRIRFYSDKGLLPPAARAESGYRVYSEADRARLDLILALRDAGVKLGDIARLIARRLGLADVLALRLDAIEAEISAKRRIAAALRATLRLADPTPQDLRRLWTVTALSKTQFRTAIEAFYAEAGSDARMDPAWRDKMIAAATPDLPDDPTTAQLDAWTELMGMLTDKSYRDEMQVSMRELWHDGFDPAAYRQASDQTFAQVRAAMAKGIAPDSDTGRAIAEAWLESSARAMKKEPDAAFLDWQLEQYRKHHARSRRYLELMAILRGDPPGQLAASEWGWIVEALSSRL